jgi:multicomponent Na+:H+ antiporter subunit F
MEAIQDSLGSLFSNGYALALFILSGALVMAFYRLVRGPSLADRVVALDLGAVLIVGMIVTISIWYDTRALLDVALVVALVAFLGTVAFARYLELRA